MISSDFRAEARRKLTGKWGKAALFALAYFVTFFVIGFITGLLPESMEWLISLATIVIEIPLGFGFIFAFFKLFNDEEVKAFDFISLGFSNFKKAWGVSLRMLLKMIVPVILIIISYIVIAFAISMAAVSAFTASESSFAGASIFAVIGFILLIVSMVWSIIKSYSYQLSYFMVMDNPEMSSKEAVEKSAELMNGKRGKLFCLQLSFIGWTILAVLPFYIGIFWLIPYMQMSLVAFYKFAKGENSDVQAEVIAEDNNNPIQ